jgi:hypothetical protein
MKFNLKRWVKLNNMMNFKQNLKFERRKKSKRKSEKRIK